MGVVEELVGIKCPNCHHKLVAASNFMHVGIDVGIKEIIVPAVFAYFGMTSVRPSYMVCVNSKCEMCYSENNKVFFKLNLMGKPVQVVHLGDKPKTPKKKKFKLF